MGTMYTTYCWVYSTTSMFHHFFLVPLPVWDVGLADLASMTFISVVRHSLLLCPTHFFHLLKDCKLLLECQGILLMSFRLDGADLAFTTCSCWQTWIFCPCLVSASHAMVVAMQSGGGGGLLPLFSPPCIYAYYSGTCLKVYLPKGIPA